MTGYTRNTSIICGRRHTSISKPITNIACSKPKIFNYVNRNVLIYPFHQSLFPRKLMYNPILHKKLKIKHENNIKCAAITSPAETHIEKEFTLHSGEFVKVFIEGDLSQKQHIVMVTNHPSPSLLLHWGLEGGKGYKGGWRLLGRRYRPEGTIQYKERALQTLWRTSTTGLNEIVIDLEGDEVSDALNFVLKDEKSGLWYDNNGSNFRVSLKPVKEKMKVTEIPEVPTKMCSIWAYLKWEIEGCPNRSQANAEKEFKEGIEEIKSLLYDGIPLKKLWSVAIGEVDFKQFREENGLDKPKAAVIEEVKPVVPEPVVPKQVAPPPPPKVEIKPKKKEEPLKQVELGESRGIADADVMKLIKPHVEDEAIPLLSEEKKMPREKPMDFIVQNAALDSTTKWRRLFPLGSKEELFVNVNQEVEKGPYTVTVTTDAAFPLVLHWGISKTGKGRSWLSPPSDIFPQNTEMTEDKRAAQTPFIDCKDLPGEDYITCARVPLQRVKVEIPWDSGISNVQFVLRSSDKSKWWKDGQGNYVVPLPGIKGAKPSVESKFKDEMTKTLVDMEVNKGSWTLMHRFNAAADFIDNVLNANYSDISPADAMARIFIWLRYSSTRQITWQRNYNTKPRELAHSQERLTNVITHAHAKTTGEIQEWIRLMIGNVGRGGDGQKIRDEILHIMHRNKIPEKHGLWLEAWHQKLHNNTTPDDVPICEAYIAFLEGNGDINAYWRILSDAGITRERMESFERPVKGDPQFHGDKKDGLIRDMYNYLGILKNVHSGADFQASVAAAQNSLPNNTRGHVGYVQAHMNDNQILPFLEEAVEARMELRDHIRGNRELLYLDLALENQVRQAVERGGGLSGIGAANLITPLLQNLCLSAGDNEEICFCLMSWQGLPASIRKGYPNQEEALQGVAVLDRLRRALSEMSDKIFSRIGEPSMAMGEAFGAEDWAVQLFAEEVIRGGPAFALSLVLGNVDSALRAQANLGSWQIISPVTTIGRIDTIPGLFEVQEKVYSEPTILIAKRVSGEEEIPEGVVGLLTPDAPDVLSHVSVRARNMNVLFATCHDSWHLDDISKKKGRILRINPAASGEVRWEEVDESELKNSHNVSGGIGLKPPKWLKMDVPKWGGKYSVQMKNFKKGVVGAKSRNIGALREIIPSWIKLPASVTVPFGSFEAVLDMKENREIKQEIAEVLKQLSKGSINVLAQCRQLIMDVKLPDSLIDQITKDMKEAGIPVPSDGTRWNQAISALKGVWASKYNDRAYFSMKKVGLKLEDLRMAVLIQRVVPAEYAFVIHTKNPSTGNENEVYCEIVKGLGESLVSGMVPGSSMAFVAKKNNLDNPEVLLYPSKSAGMFVKESLIFRSDSNGEDLEGYAGAGLYESITMDPTELRKVDYVGDKLIQDGRFRHDLLSRICKVGYEIEKALGSAQDVEGVVGKDGSITVVQTRPQV